MARSTIRSSNLLVTYMKPQWMRVLLLIVLLFSTIGLELANPQILRVFIDTATTHGVTQTLVLIALAFIGIAILGQLVSIVETYVAENVGLTATNRLRADLTMHCLRLDPAFHSAHTPGELIERVDGDVGTLSNFFSRLVVALVGNAFLLLGVLIMLFLVDWRVGSALTAFVILSLIIVNSIRNIGVPYWQKAMQSEAELFGFIEERLAGTEDLRSSGATGYTIRGLQGHSRTVLFAFVRAIRIGISSWATTLFLFTVGTAVALSLGIYLFQTGLASIGTVYLIFSYTTLLDRPIEQIVRQIEDLQKATASIGRIRTLFAEASTIVDGEQTQDVPQGALSVELEHVNFQYAENVPVLKDISLRLEPGMVMGLLGRTGSGKTTLTKLLVRLYEPTQGKIRLGGIDIRATRLENLRQHVGVVTQDIQLFHASVRDNLTFFDRSIADERILEVLEKLGLASWYQSLAHGLNTKLAPGGSGLSAGEAQLLAFARVFLKDPGLVILDEASSRLDLATERRLEQAIDTLLKSRTCIIVAHRLTTVQRADTILILEDGQCREYGVRATLAADAHSRFAHLLRTGLEEVLA